MKEQIRSIGIDDGSFQEFKGKLVVVGVVIRGNSTVENILCDEVTIDGEDSTNVIMKIVRRCRQRPLHAIFLNGIALAGFNVVDIHRLSKALKIPVIAVVRKKPNLRKIRNALKNVPNEEKKWRIIKSLGPLRKYKNISFQVSGIDEKLAKELIEKSIYKSSIPESIRLAHMIASGITKGETSARA